MAPVSPLRLLRTVLVATVMFAALVTTTFSGTGQASAVPVIPERADVASSAANDSAAAASTVAAKPKWSAKKFAQTWLTHAGNRDWAWIRNHSDMATDEFDDGVSLDEIKYWLRGRDGFSKIVKCGPALYFDEPMSQECWTRDAMNVAIQRKGSGRLIATHFWVED